MQIARQLGLSATNASWITRCNRYNLRNLGGCGPINKVSEVVNDPQVLARNMVVDLPHPEVPDLRVPGPPLKLTATPPTVRRYPPLLGEHNEEILADAGYNPEQISQLRKKGVIGGKATAASPGQTG